MSFSSKVYNNPYSRFWLVKHLRYGKISRAKFLDINNSFLKISFNLIHHKYPKIVIVIVLNSMNSANYPDYNYLIYPLCIFLLFFFYYSSLFLSTRLWNWETFRPIFIKHGIYLLHLVSYHRCILINSQLAKSYNSKCVLIDVRIKFNIYICIYGWKCDLWLYTTLIQDTIIQDRSAFLRVFLD